MTFEDCIDLVINHEGGYVNDPKDPGGETKFGISKRAYPTTDIKNLTLEEAKEIYRKDYWIRASCDKIPEQVRYIHFDTGINMGLKTAAIILQRACNVSDDGVIGSKTLKAAEGLKLIDYAFERLYYYCQLIRKRQSLSVFIGGWSNRVKDILKKGG